MFRAASASVLFALALSTTSAQQPAKKDPDPTGLIKSYLGHDGAVRSVDFTPDGKKLYSVGEDKSIRIWDLINEKKHIILGEKLKYRPTLIAIPEKPLAMKGFYTDGGLHEDRLTLWDLANKRAANFYGNFLYGAKSLSVSLDGKYLICGTADSKFMVWDTTNGNKIFEYDAKQGHVHGTAISNDGKRMACSTDSDGTIRVWDVATKKQTWRYKPADKEPEIYALRFLPDGKKILAAYATGNVKIHDIDGKAEAVDFKCHAMRINGMDITKDGELLVTCSEDKTLKVWDVKTQKELHEFKHTGEVFRAKFSPDGKRIASCSKDEAVSLWGMGKE